MRILHIAPIGHQSEGIGTVLTHLVKEQTKLGHDVRIVTKYTNVVYDDLQMTTIKDPQKFRVFIDNWIPDVVLFHSLYEMEFLKFAKILNYRNIPYAVQMHGALSKVNYNKNHFKKLVANLLWYNGYLKRAKSIIYLNKEEYDNCVVNNINPNYSIIPNGCEVVRDLEFRETINHPIEIVYIGRIDINHKGLDELVKAIRLLKDRGENDLHFSFYGNENDPDVGEFKQMLQGLHTMAQFYGGIYGEEKRKKLQNSDLFILTSRYEGMPMGVLESISYGLPCFVTPGTNMADIIKESDAGWVADFSSESIANTLIKAISDLIERSKIIRRNAYDLSKRFSWSEIAKSSIMILSRLIE